MGQRRLLELVPPVEGTTVPIDIEGDKSGERQGRKGRRQN